MTRRGEVAGILALLFAGWGGLANAAQTGAPTTGPVQPEARAFHDWIAVCDNGLRCVALGPAEALATGWIRVGMDAGPEARPGVALGVWTAVQHLDRPPVTLHIDGVSWLIDQGDVVADHPAGTVRPQDAGAVVAALAAGRTVQVQVKTQITDMSARGAAAALLWIDEKQGRLDTPLALFRRGDRPSSAVPAGPDLPLVAAASVVDQPASPPPLPQALDRLPDVMDCGTETGLDTAARASMVQHAHLDAETQLWSVPCFIAAYNVGEIWYLTDADGNDPRRVTLPYPIPSASGEPSWNGTTNGGYNAATRTLSELYWGRGPRDCGNYTQWTWTDGAFELMEDYTMTECWGVPMDLWPTRWRSR